MYHSPRHGAETDGTFFWVSAFLAAKAFGAAEKPVKDTE
jgi:hypothetical protein